MKHTGLWAFKQLIILKACADNSLTILSFYSGMEKCGTVNKDHAKKRYRSKGDSLHTCRYSSGHLIPN